MVSAGGKVTREAGPVKGGKSVIAFVEDNTGYKWELIQKPADFLAKKRDPILHVRMPLHPPLCTRSSDLREPTTWCKAASRAITLQGPRLPQ